MERGLALAIWIIVTMETVTAKLLSRAGVMDTRADWQRFLADHSTLWLMLIPFVYAGMCEMSRGSSAPAIFIKVTRVIGFLLLAVFLILLVLLVFG